MDELSGLPPNELALFLKYPDKGFYAAINHNKQPVLLTLEQVADIMLSISSGKDTDTKNYGKVVPYGCLVWEYHKDIGLLLLNNLGHGVTIESSLVEELRNTIIGKMPIDEDVLQ